MKKQYNNGITLIALVVTIIILLILAGVSINLVFDADGLFAKTNDAASRYNQAKENEIDFLNGVMNILDKYPNNPEDNPYVEDNTKKKAPDGDYYIPDGFKEPDDSGDTIKDGKVVEDKNGNQYVWIPAYVENGVISSEYAMEYKLTNFGEEYNDDGFDYYTDTIDSNDVASIKKYGGYYIGRFETGNDGNNNAVIKSNQDPFTSINFATCETLANQFGTNNRYNLDKMYTKLACGFGWDTALCFIQNSYPTYATDSSEKGNYNNVRYENTGLTTAVCNIYDMGGNVRERTSEKTTDEDFCVDRGGDYGATPKRPAGTRAYEEDGAYENYGFRTTLYLK